MRLTHSQTRVTVHRLYDLHPLPSQEQEHVYIVNEITSRSLRNYITGKRTHQPADGPCTRRFWPVRRGFSAGSVVQPGAHLIQHHPVRVDLGIPERVQDDRLEGSEVRHGDVSVFRTGVHLVAHFIVIKVALTHITHSVR